MHTVLIVALAVGAACTFASYGNWIRKHPVKADRHPDGWWAEAVGTGLGVFLIVFGLGGLGWFIVSHV
jgi:hypothetical protein